MIHNVKSRVAYVDGVDPGSDSHPRQTIGSVANRQEKTAPDSHPTQ